MKKIKQKIAAALSCVSALALAACSADPTPSFDATRPWHDAGDSYERLEYAVSVYNTEKGTGEGRITIGEGTVTFTLKENIQSDSDDKFEHTELAMSMSVTYNDDAPEAERGCTDTIESRIEWQTDSLVTAKSYRKVTLEPRDGESTNLSYTITADYFGTKKATREMYGVTKTMSIPHGAYYDNEMLFYLARTSSIDNDTSLPFYLTNIFDCFLTGKFSSYTMVVSVGGRKTENIGDWVSSFGIEKYTAESGEEFYPISCYDATISISADRYGPPYYVSYSAVPFANGGKEHSKIPVRIRYDTYSNGSVARQTEYVLTGCSFSETE